LPYFVKDEVPNYVISRYNVVLESPTVTGGHIEPPNGGLAFIFYAAIKYRRGKIPRRMQDVLDYLQDKSRKTQLRSLEDYAPYVAAILNARYGTDYDCRKIHRFIYSMAIRVSIRLVGHEWLVW
jgi:hypothetical protein